MSSGEYFIPRRIANTLRGIYQNRVTVVCAPDGTGKSTLLREFTRRTRPTGTSIRFIRSARSTGECFKQLSSIIVGEELNEPLTDRELTALTQKFSASAQKKPLVIIVDCEAACRTLFGNLRTAKLLSECSCARFVFLCPSLKNGYRELARNKGFLLIEREQLCLNIAEVAEFAERCGAAISPADVYNASGGAFLGTRVCVILAQQGQDFTNLTAEGRIIRALFGGESCYTAESLRLQAALIAAATYPVQSEQFCSDLLSFHPITDYFGREVFTPNNIITELESLNRVIPLIEINHRSHGLKIHPLLIHTAYTLFYQFPENVRHDLRICFAREYLRREQYFFAFCEYFLAGEYELAAGVHARDVISYSMLIKSSNLLRRFVNECPMDFKPIIPRLLRVTALLMHTDAKPMLAGKFSLIKEHITSSPDYDSTERKKLTSYADALQTSENFYVLDKMGSSIKRAYDMYKGRQRYESPNFPWTLYSPSVFCLLHRRGYSLQTENDQFVRYQHMYTEMMGHGRYAELVFTGEMKYYRGEPQSALEYLSTAATLCSDKAEAAMKLAALFSASKCCMFLGDYTKFFGFLEEIHTMERSHIGQEEADCARLCLGMLRAMRGGSFDDMWFALTTAENDVLYNRYTAPYFVMSKATCMITLKQYDRLADNIENFLQIAQTAGNEVAAAKLQMYGAQAFLALGNYDTAIGLFSEGLQAVAENFTPTAGAEFYAMYPDIFTQLTPLISERLQQETKRIAEIGSQYRRGIEAVRTYEITYLSNNCTENYAERYLAPLDRVMRSTDELRRSLGLTKPAYSYAIMAASGLSNAEMSILFNVTVDSIKSSLKRTCAALGVKKRRELVGKIPALK